MTWWRRDSTFSPVQRYAQRLLRSHESALRTRGFSRTPPQNAPHGDDKGSDRPAGMSNLEWMQLQHYQRWRKKLMEDPYQTLFGASNDMLNGKGLKDWEWISNSFPKWMLREIGGHEDANPPSKRDKDTNSSKRYSKKTEMENVLSSSPRERESYFPQPTPRTTRIGGDDSRGIISPSDLRRPREHPEVTGIGKSVETSTEPSSDTHGSTVSASAPQTSQHTPPTPPKTTQSFSDYIVKTKSNAASKVEHLDKTQNESGASFMDGFLSENPQQEERTVSSSSDVSTWKETTLQRRLSQSDVMKHKASEETSASTPVVKEGENASSISVASEHPRMPPVAETIPTAATHESQKLPKSEDKNTLGDSAVPTRSTSETLSQLPEDDIDFLSAADIRASMGMKRSKIVSDEQKKAERENLEKSFTDAHVESEGVDPMIESKVINDQLVRRIERKMQMPDEPEVNESQPTTKPEQSSDLASETQIESSIERMRSWLEQGGAIFSNYFWQDPTEEANAKETRLFFDKVLARIRKGRSTMKQVIEDLETDIPSSKPLLKRMKADEDLLDSAIHALRQRSGSGKMQPLTPKKVRAIQSLRLKYQDTDSDLNKAYVALQEIDKSDSAKNMPLAFKQRLGLAAKIIQKNAHLTRYLIWSLQARLEDPDIDPTMLPNYKAVANSLLTLRDTQMALSRLVDRAMLVYGVMPQTVENVDSMGQTSVNTSTQHGEMLPSEASASMTEVDKAQLRAKIAAEERLANEVDAQKSAMRGLSDDGYVRESNEIGKKPFEERSPLDHSLYRPFGQVLQSLGSELPLGMEATKPQEKATQKYNDAELVVELQKAYEDTYGPITAGHMQVAEAAEEMKQEQENDVKKFDMLKDDPTTCDEAPQQASVTQMPETQVTEETTEAVATPQAVQEDDAVTAQPECSVEDIASSPQPTEVPPESAVETSSTASTSPVPIADLPTHYTILIHDAETNTISLTTSTSPPPRDTAPPIPLHTALSMLSSPSKFIPHITPNLEIVTAKPDMLILRDVPNPATPPSSSPNVISKPLQPTEHNDASEGTATSDLGTQRIGTVNPIDGTTRLSPTGYVGPAENREQLEKEFEERRRAAEQIAALGAAAENEHVGQAGFAGEKKRRAGGRGAGVVKTAIWAAATCYVVGVLGELVG